MIDSCVVPDWVGRVNGRELEPVAPNDVTGTRRQRLYLDILASLLYRRRMWRLCGHLDRDQCRRKQTSFIYSSSPTPLTAGRHTKSFTWTSCDLVSLQTSRTTGNTRTQDLHYVHTIRRYSRCHCETSEVHPLWERRQSDFLSNLRREAVCGYQSVGGAPFVLLRYVGDVGEDHGEGHSENP